MIDVICAYWREPTAWCGGFNNHRYTPEWVDKLARGVKRNLTMPYRFVCLTDEPAGAFAEDVETVPFIHRPHVGTWMSLCEMMRPDLGDSKRMTMGIDTIIVGSLDEIASYPGPFGMTRARVADLGCSECEDHNNTCEHHSACNALCVFDVSHGAVIWNRYMANPKHANAVSVQSWSRGQPSEMEWWRQCIPYRDLLDDFYPGQIVCYNRRHEQGLANARVVYFFGHTKPGNVSIDPLVMKHWR